MSAYDSLAFQSEMTEIMDLYNQLDVSRKDAYESLPNQEKITIIDSIDILMRKMIAVYNALLEYNDFEANSHKESIRTYADNMDLLRYLENQDFGGGIDSLIESLRIRL